MVASRPVRQRLLEVQSPCSARIVIVGATSALHIDARIVGGTERRRNGADLPDRRSWSYASLRRSQQVRRDHALQRSEHHRSRRWQRDGRELHHRPHLFRADGERKVMIASLRLPRHPC